MKMTKLCSNKFFGVEVKTFDDDTRCGKYDKAIAAKGRTENEHEWPRTKISIVSCFGQWLNGLDRGPKRHSAVSKR